MEAEHEAEQGVGLLLRVALAVGEAVGQVRMEVGEEEDRGDGCATPTSRSVRGGAGGRTGAGAGDGGGGGRAGCSGWCTGVRGEGARTAAEQHEQPAQQVGGQDAEDGDGHEDGHRVAVYAEHVGELLGGLVVSEEQPEEQGQQRHVRVDDAARHRKLRRQEQRGGWRRGGARSGAHGGVDKAAPAHKPGMREGTPG